MAGTWGSRVERREAIMAIERAAWAISNYNLDAIRAGMNRYYDKSREKGRGAKAEDTLYILNHYLFELPPTFRRDSPYAHV